MRERRTDRIPKRQTYTPRARESEREKERGEQARERAREREREQESDWKSTQTQHGLLQSEADGEDERRGRKIETYNIKYRDGLNCE